MGRTAELGWGQELRSMNCSSLGSAEGMGEVTQLVPASRAPSKADLKLAVSKEALKSNSRVGSWAERLQLHYMVGGKVNFLLQLVLVGGLEDGYSSNIKCQVSLYSASL